MSDVALWYQRYGSPTYDLYKSEHEAAEMGAWLEDDERGVVIGIQFPDGRTVAREDWEPYQTAKRKLLENARKAVDARASAPPRPTRRILDPFRGQLLTVDADEPEWLGRPA